MECLLCGHNAELQDGQWKGYKEPDTFEIFHCSNCDTSFSFPQISDSEIYNQIYKYSSQLPGYWRYDLFANMVKTQKNPLSYLAKEEEIYWSVKKIVEKTVKDKTQYKILDVGCGLGYLTYCLRQDSYNAIGIDISAKAIVQATERFGDFYKRMDIFDPSPDAEMRFDIIILTEVIEHINNPILFLEQLIKYLNDNGKIIVTTPNKSASSKQCVWDTDLPPIHQWWFTKKSLRFMGQNLHLGVRFINFSGFYFKKFQSLKKTTAICDKNSITSHLDKNGELIIKTETLKQTSIVRGVLSKIFPLKFIYKFFVRFINWIQYMRSGEGRIVCAVFEKQ